MPRTPRKRDLTFYLLKDEVTGFEECLSEAGALVSHPVQLAGGTPAALFIRAPRSTPPWWLDFLRTLAPEIPDMCNANTAAVLFLAVDGARFAITFGYGRSLLELDKLVRDFGLRTALNTIDPETLRSVDSRTFEELSVARKIQTSRPAALENFSLNRSEDILKAVTGTPVDPHLGHRITGADAAKLTYVAAADDLPTKCRQLLAGYRSTAYRTRFDFIDHMREVRDLPTVSRLDEMLLHKLRTGDENRLHLAPPEVSDWAEMDSFVFSRRSTAPASDLEARNYTALFERPEDISLATLKRDKVGVMYGTAAEPHYKWRVYDVVVCEVPDAESLYVLTGGSWYRIEPSFATRIAADVATRTTEVPWLPPATVGETEPDYNARAARPGGPFLFDEKTARPTGAMTDIEFADLVTVDRKIVHVKRKSRSSTLSHLFAQGLQSAEVFYADPGFGNALKTRAATEISAAAAAVIPDAKPVPEQWTIVYAIITESTRPWPASLPFFSQLNFRNTAERLSRMGFNVGLARIPLEPCP